MASSRSAKRPWSDEAVGQRLLSMMVNAAEGRRSVSDDRQYQELRNALVTRGFNPPDLVFTHPTLDSFSASIRRIENKSDRVQEVRAQFEPFLQSIGETGGQEARSSDWMGITSRAARLQAVRTLLPLAETAIESIIATLSEPNANGGPLLDSRQEAID